MRLGKDTKGNNGLPLSKPWPSPCKSKATDNYLHITYSQFNNITTCKNNATISTNRPQKMSVLIKPPNF